MGALKRKKKPTKAEILAAAAPELLAACKAALPFLQESIEAGGFDPSCEDWKVAHQIKAAIKRAAGEP